jgi:hypothetical protein
LDQLQAGHRPVTEITVDPLDNLRLEMLDFGGVAAAVDAKVKYPLASRAALENDALGRGVLGEYGPDDGRPVADHRAFGEAAPAEQWLGDAVHGRC